MNKYFLPLNHVCSLDRNFEIEQQSSDISVRTELNNMEFPIYYKNQCPICHFGLEMSQNVVFSCHNIHSLENNNFHIFTIHFCPHCNNDFLVDHNMECKEGCEEVSQTIYPYKLANANIDDEIKKISPSFYSIYNQSLTAKELGLTEIYGMGFRKAIEYLVKDYAIKKRPEDSEQIKKISLHKCIEKYFEDADTESALLGAKHLGNNEVHYTNSNSAEDLILLEQLIDDILYYIKRELRLAKVKEISESK